MSLPWKTVTFLSILPPSLSFLFFHWLALRECQLHIVNLPYEETHLVRSWSQPAYSHMSELGSGFPLPSPQVSYEMRPQHWLTPWLQPDERPWAVETQISYAHIFLIYKNCGIINVFCFKLLYFVICSTEINNVYTRKLMFPRFVNSWFIQNDDWVLTQHSTWLEFLKH